MNFYFFILLFFLGLVCKTAWFDRDNPSGTGDYELLHDLLDENPDALCLSPVGIEVQTREGVPASETGQYFAM